MHDASNFIGLVPKLMALLHGFPTCMMPPNAPVWYYEWYYSRKKHNHAGCTCACELTHPMSAKFNNGAECTCPCTCDCKELTHSKNARFKGHFLQGTKD
eukprot:1162019-Pelagomonas_calceolata.AAC.8